MKPVGTFVQCLVVGSLPRILLPPISVRVDLDQPEREAQMGGFTEHSAAAGTYPAGCRSLLGSHMQV